jgi:tetratricopeptide (TPR) repeat protein
MDIREEISKELADLGEILDAAELKYRHGVETGDDVAALRLLEEAVDLVPDYAEAWQALGERYYALCLVGKAEQCFLKAAKFHGSIEAILRLAEISSGKEHYRIASNFYEAVLNRDPYNLRALLGLAKNHRNMENYLAASKAYNSTLELLELKETGGDLKAWRKRCMIESCSCNLDDYTGDEEDI